MYLAMIPSMTSSAPAPIDINLESLWRQIYLVLISVSIIVSFWVTAIKPRRLSCSIYPVSRCQHSAEEMLRDSESTTVLLYRTLSIQVRRLTVQHCTAGDGAKTCYYWIPNNWICFSSIEQNKLIQHDNCVWPQPGQYQHITITEQDLNMLLAHMKVDCSWPTTLTGIKEPLQIVFFARVVVVSSVVSSVWF